VLVRHLDKGMEHGKLLNLRVCLSVVTETIVGNNSAVVNGNENEDDVD